MKNRLYRVSIFILFITSFSSFASAACNQNGECETGETTSGCPTDCVLSCSSNADCEDGYAITEDVCSLPGSLNSYCTHYAKRPIIFAYEVNSNYSQSVATGIIDNADVLESFTWGISNPSNKAKVDALKAAGKIVAERVQVTEFLQVSNESIEANRSYYVNAIFQNFSKKFNAGLDAVAFDELLYADWSPQYTQLMSAASTAIQMLKKAYPRKLIFSWGSSRIPYKAITNATLKRILTYSDFYMPEYYIQDKDYTKISGLAAVDASFSSFYPGIGRKIIVRLAAADSEHLAYDNSPEIDFKKLLDNEFLVVKTQSNKGFNSGIAVYSTARLNFETSSWLAKLFKHYFLDGKNELFSPASSNINLTFIKNPGFEKGLSDWSVLQGNEVKTVDYLNASQLNPLLYRLGYPNHLTSQGKIPEGGQVLFLRRGATQNLVSQNASIEPGKNYFLEVHSKKHSGDFGESGVRTRLLDSWGVPINSTYNRITYCAAKDYGSYGVSRTDCFKVDYNISLGNGTDIQAPNESRYWTKEEFVVNSNNGLVVRIDDENAAQGDINLVDFVQLQEYTLPFCGNSVCEEGENIANCPSDCSISCSSNSDCEDDYNFTEDICNNAGTNESYCIHQARKPISLCYGLKAPFQEYYSSDMINQVTVFEGAFNSSFAAWLKSRDRMLASHVSVTDFYEISNETIAANKSYYVNAIFENFSKKYKQGFDAISFDEYIISDYSIQRLQLMSATADAMKLLKKAYPSKLIFSWGGYTVPTNPFARDVLNRSLTYSDYFMEEIYIDDAHTSKLGLLLKGDADYVKFNPTIGNKLLIGLSVGDMEESHSQDQDPGSDFRKLLDVEFNMVKNHTNLGLNKGISLFACCYPNYESKVWISKLFHHYFQNNQTTLFSTGNWTLNYLKNPGFEKNKTGWNFTPGQDGIMRIVSYSNVSELDPILVRRSWGSKIPDGQSVLFLKRGSSSNLAEQLANVEIGKTYSLEVYSKKHSGDFNLSHIKTVVKDEQGRELNITYLRRTLCLTKLYTWSYNISADACFAINDTATLSNGTKMLFPKTASFWTREEFLFAPKSNNVLIRISDESASPGEASVVDFVQLQEYTLPLCGNTVCEGDENTTSCPSDCTTPTTTTLPSQTTTTEQGCANCGGSSQTLTSQSTTSTTRQTTTTLNPTTSTQAECHESETKCIESQPGNFLFQCTAGTWVKTKECKAGCTKIGVGGECKPETNQTLENAYSKILSEVNSLLADAKKMNANVSVEENQLNKASAFVSSGDFVNAVNLLSETKKTLLEKIAEKEAPKLNENDLELIGACGVVLGLITFIAFYAKRKRTTLKTIDVSSESEGRKQEAW
ncbi:hypothetical protein HY991_00075 [Candidatus Micrarchaeota archaeon]|nr:hypothetical protein [Candidatus Micrarchaeota archaeon]